MTAMARYLVGNGDEVIREMEHFPKHGIASFGSVEIAVTFRIGVRRTLISSFTVSFRFSDRDAVDRMWCVPSPRGRYEVLGSQEHAGSGNLARVTESLKSLPLPDDPVLAAWASALNEAGYWADVFDARWHYAFVTDELRVSYGDLGATTMIPIGSHFFSTECMQFAARELGGLLDHAGVSSRWFLAMGRYVLASTPGGRDELRGLVDPELSDLVDELQPQEVPLVWVGDPSGRRAARA